MCECVLGHENTNPHINNQIVKEPGKLGTIVGVLDNMRVGLCFSPRTEKKKADCIMHY